MTATRPPGETLTMALQAALDSGNRPPCTRRDRWHLWTSDDIEERDSAAAQCGSCTIVGACRAAAEHHGERWGIWGGVDRDPKRRKRTRHE